jgi:hypothetical protein
MIKREIYYWPKHNELLLKSINKGEQDYMVYNETIWYTESKLYWSYILDHTNEFVYIGEL